MVSKITSSSNRQVRTRVLLRANATALINRTIAGSSPPIPQLCLGNFTSICPFLGQKLLIQIHSDDNNDNDNNDTNTNSDSNANADNAAYSSDTVNHKMNPEEEEERKRNSIFQLIRSENMEEVRISFEINYE